MYSHLHWYEGHHCLFMPISLRRLFLLVHIFIVRMRALPLTCFKSEAYSRRQYLVPVPDKESTEKCWTILLLNFLLGGVCVDICDFITHARSAYVWIFGRKCTSKLFYVYHSSWLSSRRYTYSFKGTVAWDFRPPLFSIKRTYLGPWYIS